MIFDVSFDKNRILLIIPTPLKTITFVQWCPQLSDAFQEIY